MEKLDISKPAESDRIIGFTIPRNGNFYVCDHDEVWSVEIAEPPRIEVTDYAPYEFVGQSRDFVGLVFEGLSENRPLMQAGGNEISWNFDPKADFVTVKCKVGGRAEEVKFRTFSGDWFTASLSDDGKYLVLADPYLLEAYKL